MRCCVMMFITRSSEVFSIFFYSITGWGTSGAPVLVSPLAEAVSKFLGLLLHLGENWFLLILAMVFFWVMVPQPLEERGGWRRVHGGGGGVGWWLLRLGFSFWTWTNQNMIFLWLSLIFKSKPQYRKYLTFTHFHLMMILILLINQNL